jgi:hypothetical protein
MNEFGSCVNELQLAWCCADAVSPLFIDPLAPPTPPLPPAPDLPQLGLAAGGVGDGHHGQ